MDSYKAVPIQLLSSVSYYSIHEESVHLAYFKNFLRTIFIINDIYMFPEQITALCLCLTHSSP
jgi:hypothetical protein